MQILGALKLQIELWIWSCWTRKMQILGILKMVYNSGTLATLRLQPVMKVWEYMEVKLDSQAVVPLVGRGCILN
ncbi:hypothetical protein L7F22_057880, partial [Adiantum nelumboides]|nr:hypothetical protein [Adiantum nelumboides]